MDPKVINNMLSKVALYRELDGKLRILSLGVYNNALRLYIKEMGENKKSSKLLFTMSIPADKIRILLSEMENLHKRELKDNKYDFEIAIYGLKWDKNNKPIPEEKDYIGSLGLGKIRNEKDEVINFIYVKNKAETKYVFPFLKTPYEEFFINGERVTNKTIISKLKLEGYRKLLEDVISSFLEVQTPNLEYKKDNKSKEIDNTVDTTSESTTKTVVADDIDDMF